MSGTSAVSNLVRWRSQLAILVGILCLIVALYWRVSNYGFVSYDDDLFVTDNPVVEAGLSVNGLAWAFENTINFYPLTWLSLMLDVTLYGPNNPGGMHFTNVILHAINSVLVFFLLKTILESEVTAGVVTVLFAIHPINVESVAWISERKGLLSSMFQLLVLLVYVSYVRSPSRPKWALIIALYFAGMLSKPTLLILPLLLVVLDATWLQRQVRLRVLVEEKAILFLLSGFFLAGTLITQRQAGASELGHSQLTHGVILQVINNYSSMAYQLVWPNHFSFFYPLHSAWSLGTLVAGVSLGGALTSLILLRRWRIEFGGLLWYLLLLFPTSGIVQIGGQAYADRYSYIPAIGLFVAFATMIQRIPVDDRRFRMVFVAALTTGVTIPLAMVTYRQITVWQNNDTLYRHALKTDPTNQVALNNLAWEMATTGHSADPTRAEEAVRLAERACGITRLSHMGFVHTLVTCYVNAGQIAKAKELSRQMLGQIKWNPQSDPMAAYFTSVIQMPQAPE